MSSTATEGKPGEGWASEETPLCKEGSAQSTSRTQQQQQQPVVPSPVLLIGKEEPPRLNTSQNVVLLFRMQELCMLSRVNFTLAVATLVYIAISIVLIVLNAMMNGGGRCREDPGEASSPFVPRCGAPVSGFFFHALEFWSTAAYAVVTAFALVYTPRALSSVYNHPLLLKVVLLFDVVATLVPALLITSDMRAFENWAHEIEYANELTMSFVDVVLLLSLLQPTAVRRQGQRPSDLNAWIAACAAAVAVIQMSIYNSRLDHREVIAHYCEFAFEIISALISFWFCMDNKASADLEISQIMYGTHRDCSVCRSKAVELLKRVRPTAAPTHRNNNNPASTCRPRANSLDVGAAENLV